MTWALVGGRVAYALHRACRSLPPDSPEALYWLERFGPPVLSEYERAQDKHHRRMFGTLLPMAHRSTQRGRGANR